MKLYTFSICGRKFYAIGALSQDEVEEIENKSIHLYDTISVHDPQKIFKLLMDKQKNITPIEVEYIFRINYS